MISMYLAPESESSLGDSADLDLDDLRTVL